MIGQPDAGKGRRRGHSAALARMPIRYPAYIKKSYLPHGG